MGDIEIRRFTRDDFQKLGGLYHAVTSREDAVFWWVGDEENWTNVFIALEGEEMIGKGQVSVITAITQGSPKNYKHYIYFNLKVLPEREGEYAIYDLLYDCLIKKAYQLREQLQYEYRTMIAIGNQSTEEQNNHYFKKKGFTYRKSAFTMNRSESEAIEHAALSASYCCQQCDLSSKESMDEYLRADMEIWPEAPIGLQRLMEIMENSEWTTFAIREKDTLVGSVMAWVDEDGDGVIEDLFVREPWRRKGIAKYLLTQALTYLKNHDCTLVELQVETANESALSLYHSIGFKEVSEEVYYHKEL
ncbi:hypothetical protein J14TS2_32350 [Bacillus sp. J14TS2]|uniref:GNAT family N-acetyltransferase n=1 Tax=Bacillus sp. J14TS2 TaxID=2807188 RepID=UPI001B0979C5|nr:GNAT family N-acetyltransferase [Bacillus sp. J14TS2]GIN72760.1 hypothetical protein J14TS2_32350 [Bacillus sp. J14TS2]